MRKAAILFALVMSVSAAQAQNARTFMSATGVDTPGCGNGPTVTPCRSLQMALSTTNAYGEVVALTPVGYGPATITQPVTIVGITDAVLITVPASGAGLVVNAPGPVIIEGMRITCQNNAGAVGLSLQQGQLILRNTKVRFCPTTIQAQVNTILDWQ